MATSETADHGRPARPDIFQHHPVVLEQQAQRAADFQLRIADKITAFAGSMNFVYLHIALFTVWMLFIESKPWPTPTLIVSLEAIFLSTFVMIGQPRGAGLPARRSSSWRISAASTIDRATAVQISHCRTSSLTVFITVWKMLRTVDSTSR